MLADFSRIKSDRQVKRQITPVRVLNHFSRIKSNKQAKKPNDFTAHNPGKTSGKKRLRLSAILHGLHNTGVCG